VISYYVTVAINADDPRLKGGQTANVTVATSERSNVLTVPNAAVRRVDGKSQVTVVEGDSFRKATFEAGEVGIDRTEVVSGLREGQRVVLPIRQQGEQK
jgi:HlyD family secretion protein